MGNDLVLVTGGSGFIGSHCIFDLLNAGYRVRTTVRGTARQAEILDTLRTAGIEPGERLTFAIADLNSDAGWPEAVAGCRYVLHVASPLPTHHVTDENEIIAPAREGTLRVLRAARDGGVSRVVFTSSFGAIGYGQPQRTKPFDETDWSNPASPDLTAYPKSKTLAEMAAWKFIADEGGSLELTVINPVAVFGPTLSAHNVGSHFAQRLLNGSMPACPRLFFGAVDVRDVAMLHRLAMTLSEAAGQRYLAVAGETISVLDVANILRKGLGARASKVPTRNMPDWVLRIFAIFRPEIKGLLPEIGKMKYLNGEKARRTFNWIPRTNEEAVLASGESILRFGLADKK